MPTETQQAKRFGIVMSVEQVAILVRLSWEIDDQRVCRETSNRSLRADVRG